MSWLVLLLLIKISVTLMAVALPCLVLSSSLLTKFSGIRASNAMFRLYGVAILSLLLGYSFGLQQAVALQIPWPTLWVGLFSNAGAAVVLFRSRLGRKAIIAGGFFALIALALAVCCQFPQAAISSW